MKLVVGLGNPGPKYETTRHNVGFLAVDYLVEQWRARGPLLKSMAEVFECEHQGERVLLIKPQTYMNRSGQSVGEICRFYKIAPEDLLVIHDDVDLVPLQLRFKKGGGSGGHNGLKSIDSHLGSPDYHRIRIGVGKPDFGEVADYVLHPFSNPELNLLEKVLPDIAQAADLILQGQLQQAMNRFHKRENT